MSDKRKLYATIISNKSHLLEINGTVALCGIKESSFAISSWVGHNVLLENGNVFSEGNKEIDNTNHFLYKAGHSHHFNMPELDHVFCKRCLKKARKLQENS